MFPTNMQSRQKAVSGSADRVVGSTGNPTLKSREIRILMCEAATRRGGCGQCAKRATEMLFEYRLMATFVEGVATGEDVAASDSFRFKAASFAAGNREGVP